MRPPNHLGAPPPRQVTIQWDDGKKPGTAALDALDAYGYGDNGAASQEVSRASLGSPPSELMHSANYDELLDDLTADATTMAPRAQQEDTDIDDLSPIVAYNEEMTQQTMSSYSNENKSSSNCPPLVILTPDDPLTSSVGSWPPKSPSSRIDARLSQKAKMSVKGMGN
ncbi:hypothetical protein CAPTEDRAFT_186392 [Capitella teleta]|uniref:Uncharacterized protein n=1 Tax=Capitella teleta TaxID=283909 RepID=R7UQI0_CAPTE|nr:hypothetical protein CAPTEDRAFT_186392 [Capitella teleta]|eukprot:ELU08784.1 hypothetical protein CAPTEDRAFT_186392 [Capitella teleta]